MKKTKKALASLAIASMALTMVPFNAFATGTISTRLAGTTAEETAAAIADQTGWTGTAILASSASYGAADALTAGPLSAYLKAPILLQGPGATLNPYTKAELTKLNVKTVYVTSGTAVISQGVLSELKAMGMTVESLGGNDRFDTSVNIAKKLIALGAPVKKVAVAYGWLNQDALSIASIASAANQPILLTEKAGLSASAKAFLAANPSIVTSDVIGGTGVIDAAVLAQLPSPTRHYGNTAYDTNSQVIQDFAAALTFDNVFVANGVTAIDALSGAPLASVTKSPIVLTDGVNVPSVATFTFSKSSAATVVTALGGAYVVPENVRVGIAKGEITNVSTDVKIVSVSALDDTNRYVEIQFSKAVSGIQASDITIANADTQERYGVKAVTLSSDGTIATAELFAPDADTQVLEYLQDYNVTVNLKGAILKATFNRSYSIKTRVVDIKVNDKKIVVRSDKDSSQADEGDEVTLTIPDSVDFNYQAALGELVQVWYNSDKELTSYKLLTTTSKVEAIEVKDSDTITLLGEDKDYDISTEEDGHGGDKFLMSVNGNQDYDVSGFAGLEDGLKYNFAKVGFDTSGDVEFVSAYTLQDAMIFDSMDSDEVVGLDGSTGSFDSGDATIVKDGEVIAATDLKKGDLVLFNADADGDNGYAEVISEATVTGPIDETYDGAIEVDGKTYDYDYASDVVDDFGYNQDAIYINQDGDVDDIDSDAADELQAAGDVALYTDYAGNLIYVSGDTATVDSNTKVAVLTDDMVGYTSARDKVEIEAVTEDSDELSFDISLESLDTITVDGVDYDIDNDNGASSDWNASIIYSGTQDTGIKLEDNTGAKADVNVMFTGTSAAADTGSLVKLHLDDDGNLLELEFFNDDQGDTGYNTFTSTLEAGDTYLDGYKLTSDTLLFDGTEDGVNTDGPDYEITKFGDYEGSDIPTGNFVYNDDQEVIAVWFGDTVSDNIDYQEAVVTKVLRNTDDEVVSLSVWAGGVEETYEVDQVDDNFELVKGSVVVLEFDENNDSIVQDLDTSNLGDTTQFDARVKTGLTVDTVDSSAKTVTFTNGATYKLADKGIVLDGSDASDITKESLTDLKGETNVTVVLDAKTGTFTKFFIYGLKAAPVVNDTTDPVATVTTASVNIGTDVTTAMSNEAGTAYLVLDSADLSTVTALNTAVTNGTAKKVAVTANTATDIATTGLVAGAYKVVTVDAAGNVSAESAGTITLVAVIVNPFTVAPKVNLFDITGTLDTTKATKVKAIGANATVAGTVAADGTFSIATDAFSGEIVSVQAYDAQDNAVGTAVKKAIM